MTSPSKIFCEICFFAEEESFNKSFVLIHASDSVQFKCSKKCSFYNFARYLTFYSSATTSSVSSIKKSVKNIALVVKCSAENSRIFFALRILIVRKFQRKLFLPNFSGFSELIFPRSSIRVGIKTF